MPLALLLCSLSAPGQVVSLANDRVELRFDCGTGHLDLLDRAGAVLLRGAHARVERWSTSDEGYTRTAELADCRDAFGPGRRLELRCSRANGPTLLLECRVYPGQPYLVLRAGLQNTGDAPLRLRSFAPLAGAELFPGIGMTAVRTLNAPSGATQTQVTGDLDRSSPNNLLLTFRDGGRRRSLVLGGLQTADFVKYARIGPDADRGGVLDGLWPGAKLVAYLDCGEPEPSAGDGVALRVTQGSPYTWAGAAGEPPFGSVAFHEREVIVAAEGLDPRRRYVLGWSWWDWDANGRVESVRLGDRTLVPARALPAHVRAEQPPEEQAAVLPTDASRDGKLEIRFVNEAAVPNAVVSEVWLWEAPPEAVPADWLAGRPVDRRRPDLPPRAELSAADAVGLPVAPGEERWATDSFYLDALTADPFEALELYGRCLAAANDAKPNPYDFPTVCAWYAGVWKTPGAQNHPERSKYGLNTTAGLVEEVEAAERSGFLRYSRVAGRLVPDNYTEQNPQGWWDDPHWRSQGFYVAPYATSRTWGAAMAERGGLAFTYFQPDRTSDDFRAAHPDWLLPGTAMLDYSRPDVQVHLRRCYAAMRGGIAGLMFDYCDNVWAAAQAGGFADSSLSAVGFYRTVLRLAKDGLGPDSWIHERALGAPPADLALGLADSQRTSGDTDLIDAAMVARSGLRWYKNRVVLAYDMDSKDLLGGWRTAGWRGSDQDGRRMLLTMAYVAAGRLLLANSFRELPPEVVSDLARTFPYPSVPRSARPIDAFSHDGWPRVYDFAVDESWHQLTLFNTDPGAEATITVPLSGEPADGALGLDPGRDYWVHDFWNDRSAGRVAGADTLVQTLRPGEARMLSVHAVDPNPQLVSTDRHLMQGLLELPGRPRWDQARAELSGTAEVIGGEPLRLTLATNGWRAAGAAVGGRLERGREPGLAVLTIERPESGRVSWSVRFAR